VHAVYPFAGELGLAPSSAFQFPFLHGLLAEIPQNAFCQLQPTFAACVLPQHAMGCWCFAAREKASHVSYASKERRRSNLQSAALVLFEVARQTLPMTLARVGRLVVGETCVEVAVVVGLQRWSLR